MARDPVCGMDVNPETAKHSFEFEGLPYHFCAPGCRRAFEADPRSFLDPGRTPSM